VRESALIEQLAGRLTPTRADTRLGVGDDAAIIEPGGRALAVTTDTLIEGRHFPVGTTAFDVGYKALAVNLSDLAAMTAEPAWATLALSTPGIDSDWCDAFIDGAREAIGGASVDLIGGDTTRGALAVTVTAIGTLDVESAAYRNAARVGDVIAVTGSLGDAAAGLASLSQDQSAPISINDELVARLNRPTWRKGAALAGMVHAGIDVSDGLLADLGHILEASGVGAHLNIDALPASAALSAWVGGEIDTRRRLQLTGGDDYELCLTLAAPKLEQARAAIGCALTPIGEITADRGLQLSTADGKTFESTVFSVAGWDHFDDPSNPQ